MLKVYYCPCCERFFYLQYDVNTYCRACDTKLYKLRLSFAQFSNLDEEERKEYFWSEYISSDYYREWYEKWYERKKRREEKVRERRRAIAEARREMGIIDPADEDV